MPVRTTGSSRGPDVPLQTALRLGGRGRPQQVDQSDQDRPASI
jgi:hypothetical protein